MSKRHFEHIRREYSTRSLERKDMPTNPLILLGQWLDEAVALEVYEPTAMLVATASADARPSMRTVLLKELADDRLIFYSNYTSRKGQQIEQNPRVACTFLWHELERQIHIEGSIERLSASESDAYFAQRPYKSRIGARVSPQSQVIPNREYIMALFMAESLKHIGRDVPRPEHWGGWAVRIERIEFWQGRDSRLHDRFLYEHLEDDSWSLERLAP